MSQASRCLLLLAAMTVATSSVHAAPPEAAPPCITQASESFQRGDYVTTVDEARNCWNTSGHPRAHYLEAMGNIALHRDALGLLALERYLGGDLAAESPRSVTVAKLRREEARARTVPVTLNIAPPPGKGVDVKITAVRTAGDSSMTSFTVSNADLEVGADGPLLRLDAGVWKLVLERPGYQAAQEAVELRVGEGPRKLEFAMQLERAAPATPVVAKTPVGAVGVGEPVDRVDQGGFDGKAGVPFAVAKKSMVGGVSAGGISALLGVVLVGVGIAKNGKAEACHSAFGAESCWDALAGSLRMRAAGAGLIGGGVGLLAGGLTWRFGDARTRRKGWIAEAALGGAALVGGAVWTQLSLRELKSSKGGNWTDFYNDHHAQPQHAAGVAVVGLGVGLVISSITGLVVQRMYDGRGRTMARRLRLDGDVTMGRAGLMLSGRF